MHETLKLYTAAVHDTDGYSIVTRTRRKFQCDFAMLAPMHAHLFSTLFFTAALYVSNLGAYMVGDSLDAKTLQSMQLSADNPAVISFFASWCSQCRREQPQLMQAYHALSAHDVVFIGIDIDKDPVKGKAFQKELRIAYRVMDDSDHALVSYFDPVGIPAVYLIDKGRVIQMFTGAQPDLDEKLITLMGAIK